MISKKIEPTKINLIGSKRFDKKLLCEIHYKYGNKKDLPILLDRSVINFRV